MRSKPSLRNRYVFIADLVFIVISVLGSFVLRFELGSAFFLYLPSAYWMIAVALIIKPLVYYLFGLYRRMWLYASIQELKLILVAVTSASIVTSLLVVGLFSFSVFPYLSRGVLIIDWLLSLIAVGGVRFTLRLLADTQMASRLQSRLARKALIVGAGDAGALVVRELQKNPQLNLTAVGFLDDNPAKQHQQIYGVPVVGNLQDLAAVLDKQQVDEVIIAIPSAPGKVVRMVADVCRLKAIPFRTMPGIYELLGGKVSISRLREVDITDLLRRQPAQMQDDLAGTVLSGRVVLVTGAGGSIGRELCRQIARWGPAELLLLGHGENSIFETYLEMQESYPALIVRPLIADVRNRERLERLFARYHPDVVFHAAAHKHVPLMEINVEEAVTNNILGTRNVVETALRSGVKRLVMISTDKAILPVNVMGASKRIAEMLVLDAAERSGLPYSVVRFGNVLGSRGSVVPLFKRQIARGGPVTITHPDMKRYFMTIPEAVHLVLQAAALGKGGESFVLNMGQQVRIVDLAEDLIRLSGLEPGKDIEISYIGVRPGEKLSEDLWDEGHQFQPTPHPDIYRVDTQENLRGETLQVAVQKLADTALSGEVDQVLQLFDQYIPGAAVATTPPPDLTSIDS